MDIALGLVGKALAAVQRMQAEANVKVHAKIRLRAIEEALREMLEDLEEKQADALQDQMRTGLTVSNKAHSKLSGISKKLETLDRSIGVFQEKFSKGKDSSKSVSEFLDRLEKDVRTCREAITSYTTTAILNTVRKGSFFRGPTMPSISPRSAKSSPDEDGTDDRKTVGELEGAIGSHLKTFATLPDTVRQHIVDRNDIHIYGNSLLGMSMATMRSACERRIDNQEGTAFPLTRFLDECRGNILSEVTKSCQEHNAAYTDKVQAAQESIEIIVSHVLQEFRNLLEELPPSMRGEAEHEVKKLEQLHFGRNLDEDKVVEYVQQAVVVLKRLAEKAGDGEVEDAYYSVSEVTEPLPGIVAQYKSFTASRTVMSDRNMVLKAFAELGRLIESAGGQMNWSRASDRQASATVHNELVKLATGRVYIAICGTVSAGKTTLVKALVEKDILPSSDAANTAIPTVIHSIDASQLETSSATLLLPTRLANPCNRACRAILKLVHIGLLYPEKDSENGNTIWVSPYCISRELGKDDEKELPSATYPLLDRIRHEAPIRGEYIPCSYTGDNEVREAVNDLNNLFRICKFCKKIVDATIANEDSEKLRNVNINALQPLTNIDSVDDLPSIFVPVSDTLKYMAVPVSFIDCPGMAEYGYKDDLEEVYDRIFSPGSAITWTLFLTNCKLDERSFVESFKRVRYLVGQITTRPGEEMDLSRPCPLSLIANHADALMTAPEVNKAGGPAKYIEERCKQKLNEWFNTVEVRALIAKDAAAGKIVVQYLEEHQELPRLSDPSVLYERFPWVSSVLLRDAEHQDLNTNDAGTLFDRQKRKYMQEYFIKDERGKLRKEEGVRRAMHAAKKCIDKSGIVELAQFLSVTANAAGLESRMHQIETAIWERGTVQYNVSSFIEAATEGKEVLTARLSQFTNLRDKFVDVVSQWKKRVTKDLRASLNKICMNINVEYQVANGSHKASSGDLVIDIGDLIESNTTTNTGKWSVDLPLYFPHKHRIDFRCDDDEEMTKKLMEKTLRKWWTPLILKIGDLTSRKIEMCAVDNIRAMLVPFLSEESARLTSDLQIAALKLHFPKDCFEADCEGNVMLERYIRRLHGPEKSSGKPITAEVLEALDLHANEFSSIGKFIQWKNFTAGVIRDMQTTMQQIELDCEVQLHHNITSIPKFHLKKTGFLAFVKKKFFGRKEKVAELAIGDLLDELTKHRRSWCSESIATIESKVGSYISNFLVERIAESASTGICDLEQECKNLTDSTLEDRHEKIDKLSGLLDELALGHLETVKGLTEEKFQRSNDVMKSVRKRKCIKATYSWTGRQPNPSASDKTSGSSENPAPSEPVCKVPPVSISGDDVHQLPQAQATPPSIPTTEKVVVPTSPITKPAPPSIQQPENGAHGCPEPCGDVGKASNSMENISISVPNDRNSSTEIQEVPAAMRCNEAGCECSEFSPNIFRPSMCKSCYHKRDVHQ